MARSGTMIVTVGEIIFLCVVIAILVSAAIIGHISTKLGAKILRIVFKTCLGICAMLTVIGCISMYLE